MSRDDEPQTIGEFLNGKQKSKPAVDYTYIDAKGEFTPAGEQSVWGFGKSCLISDPEGFVSIDDLRQAFENSMLGFSLERDTAGRFGEILCGKGSLTSGRRPLDFVYCEISPDWDSGLRARLTGKLGAKAFDPKEEESTAVDYLVDKLLPLHGVHMFIAKPGALKTWLAYYIAIYVSQGLSVLGRFVTKRARAVVVDFEIGKYEVRRRLRMLGADVRVIHTSHPIPDLNDEQFWTDLATFRPYLNNSEGDVVQANWLVVIDGLGSGQRNCNFGELDNRFAAPLGRAARFAEQYSATFIFIHHSPKAASLADVESLFSGTGAIRRGVDSAYYFRRLPDGPRGEERAEVISAKSRKGTAPDSFRIQLSDESGVELFEGNTKAPESPEPEPTPPTDEDKVFGVIVAEPGCSGNHIADSLEMPRKTVTAILKGLEQARKVRAEVGGKGRATSYFASVSDDHFDTV